MGYESVQFHNKGEQEIANGDNDSVDSSSRIFDRSVDLSMDFETTYTDLEVQKQDSATKSKRKRGVMAELNVGSMTTLSKMDRRVRVRRPTGAEEDLADPPQEMYIPLPPPQHQMRGSSVRSMKQARSHQKHQGRGVHFVK